MRPLTLSPSRPAPPGHRSQPSEEGHSWAPDWQGEQQLYEAWAADKAGDDPAELNEQTFPLNTCDGCGRSRTLAEWGRLTVRSGWILCPDCVAGEANDSVNPQPLEAAS